MARYQAGGTGQKWVYIFLGLLAVIAIVAFFFNPFASDKPQTIEDETPDITVNKDKPSDNKDAGDIITNVGTDLKPIVEDINNAQPDTNQPAAIDPIAQARTKIDEDIQKGIDCINATPPKIIEARDRLNDALHMDISPAQAELIRNHMSKIADAWLFSPKIFPNDTLCEVYKVKSGDVFERIATPYKVPYEILMTINRISDARSLRVGQSLKVANGPFHAKVYRSQFRMDVYLKNTFVKSFPVGLGKPGHDTPTGMWVAKPGGRLISPPWVDPDTGKKYEAEDPDYPLGSRWVALEGVSGDALGRTGFAIHGTKNPEEIGQATSRGCIRLHNGNAILVYNMMTPGLSQVEVIE